MTNEPLSDRLVWLDLEMTGLDVTRHAIVEIAVLVTDATLQPLDDGLDIVIHQPPAVLDLMDDVVRRMHEKSGLLVEIQGSPVQLADAETSALGYVRGHVPTARSAPLCGNSIGVDRRFLDRQMPALDAYVHYRNIDVSSLKELCRRWYPDVYRKRPSKVEAHRALDDVRESIAELRYYRDTILRPPQETAS